MSRKLLNADGINVEKKMKILSLFLRVFYHLFSQNKRQIHHANAEKKYFYNFRGTLTCRVKISMHVVIRWIINTTSINVLILVKYTKPRGKKKCNFWPKDLKERQQ